METFKAILYWALYVPRFFWRLTSKPREMLWAWVSKVLYDLNFWLIDFQIWWYRYVGDTLIHWALLLLIVLIAIGLALLALFLPIFLSGL